MLVRFLPVNCIPENLEQEESGEDEDMKLYGLTSPRTVPMGSGEQVTAGSVGRGRRVRLSPKAMKLVAVPLQKCKLRGFIVKIRELVEW